MCRSSGSSGRASTRVSSALTGSGRNRTQTPAGQGGGDRLPSDRLALSRSRTTHWSGSRSDRRKASAPPRRQAVSVCSRSSGVSSAGSSPVAAATALTSASLVSGSARRVVGRRRGLATFSAGLSASAISPSSAARLYRQRRHEMLLGAAPALGVAVGDHVSRGQAQPLQQAAVWCPWCHGASGVLPWLVVPGRRAVHTAWMPRSCCSSCMVAAAMLFRSGADVASGAGARFRRRRGSWPGARRPRSPQAERHCVPVSDMAGTSTPYDPRDGGPRHRRTVTGNRTAPGR